MTDRELMQDALDALNNFDKGNHGMRWQVPLIKALRARLAQPEQEPVAWFCKLPDNKISIKIVGKPTEGNWEPLYTAPPQREWIGLTDGEREQIEIKANDKSEMTAWEYAHRVGNFTEAKLKEKNT